MVLQFIANGLVIGSVYAVVALGFSLIYHTTRVFHIAHGAIYTASAYLLYLLFVTLEVPLPLSILFALIGVVSLGILVEKAVYAPILTERQSPLISFISSLGVFIVIVNLIALLFGNETKILLPGVEPTISLGSVILARIQIIQALTSILAVGSVFFFIRKNKLGHLIRALADNHQLLSVLGVKVSRVRRIVIGLGSGLAGLAGFLVALDVGIDPYIGMEVLLIAAVATIIGGIGNYGGTILGAVLLGVVQNLVVWQASARWQSAATFLILLLILVVRPQGLFSRKIRVEEI